MKNLRQSITFWDYKVTLYLAIFLIPFSGSNLCLVHLLSDIFYGMVDNFSIYSFMLQYRSFLVMSFVIALDRNLSILRLVISDSTK